MTAGSARAGPVTVVGAGITGLAAAFELSCASPAVEFEVLEAGPRVGGMVDGGPVGPLVVDGGADGFLARQPDMTDLCTELGLGDDLVSPRTGRAYIWAHGDLRPMPSPSVLGVPLDPDALAGSGIVSRSGVAEHRRRMAQHHPPLSGDASVGAVIRPRAGDEVFEYLVDPLIGGINAGRADEISIEAGAAALADAARDGGSLAVALRSRMATSDGPVFHGVRGGTKRIVDALAATVARHVVTGSAVRDLRHRPGGWEIETTAGTRSAPAVVVATPAPVTARLLGSIAPEAAAVLGAVERADVALVVFVYPREAIGRELDGSGFLVPRAEGLLTTACSWASSKWDHYDDGSHTVLRVSAGRTDDTRWLDLDDRALVDRLRVELITTLAVTGEPVAARVWRWPGSLPQYRPGHLERVAEIDRILAETSPGLFATGATFRGLGLPACVRQGRASARDALNFTG